MTSHITIRFGETFRGSRTLKYNRAETREIQKESRKSLFSEVKDVIVFKVNSLATVMCDVIAVPNPREAP